MEGEHKVHNIPTLDEKDMRVPPRWLIKKYISLNPPKRFKRKDMLEDNKNLADQFLKKSMDYYLTIKLNRGEYFAVDPSILINCWAAMGYYAELLSLNSVFEHEGLSHAFICFSGNAYADYVPERTMVVFNEDPGFGELDYFVYDFSAEKKVKLKLFGQTYELPILDGTDTALLFLSTYLPREVKAGKEIFEGLKLSQNMKDKLLWLGYSGYGGKKPNEFDVELPNYIKEKQNALGKGKIKEVSVR